MNADPEEIERLARTTLPLPIADFIAGGAGDEVTLRREREAFGRYLLEPRILTGVTDPDLSTELLGTRVDLPVGIAPMAYHRLACADGEPATVAGAAGTGALTVIATLSTESLESVAAAARAPLWFQLYCFRDRALTASLVRRAAAAGYRAIVLTVDAPRLGRRWRDVRNGFTLPAGIAPANLPASGGSGVASPAAHAAAHHDAALTWDDLAWLRSLTDLPLVLKGVLSTADAIRAADAGVDGIIVSSHGGRQLDRVRPALDALPRIADAVGGRIEVYMDGGVRHGSDALTALALGARAVFVGRTVLWGLAVAGAAGVDGVLTRLRDELAHAMILAGRAGLDDLTGLVIEPCDGGRW